jgi:glutamate--cysteine ligase
LSSLYERRLDALANAEHAQLLANIQRGIEKESLRITPQGHLAQSSHPEPLGSALCHPYITTDYSEALMEFITPVFTDIDGVLGTLDDIHRYVYNNIGEEFLWAASMPCVLEGEENIPVARYGTSNVAKMKTVYRYGLGYRYSRLMQTIAGIHYNFSMPDAYWPVAQKIDGDTGNLQDYITDRYLGLIRNFRRHSWLLIYLFGASPAVCSSFLRQNEQHDLVPFDEKSKSLHAPYGTALRMGDLGYSSDAQKNLSICYNTLDSYIETLRDAITESHEEYEAIGLGDGEHQKQLNTSLLQIENEFYSSIRPKRVARSGETALGALRRDGIEYIEVRCVDVNPFQPLGIDASQIRFMDTFLIYCLLADSELCNDEDGDRITENTRRVVNRGREPGLQLTTADGEAPMVDLAEQLLAPMREIADALDQACGGDEYAASHRQQLEKIKQPELTPSAQILQQMADKDEPFFRLAMNASEHWAAEFRRRPLDPERLHHFEQVSRESLLSQQELEEEETIDFKTYLENYFAQYDAL